MHNHLAFLSVDYFLQSYVVYVNNFSNSKIAPPKYRIVLADWTNEM